MAEPSSQDLAERIKRLRTTLGMSQREFGRLFGAEQSTVQGWESGKRPRLKYLMAIERVERGEPAAASVPPDGSGRPQRPIGERLLALRTSRDLSQRHLAALLNVSQMTVSNVERGKRPLGADATRRLERLEQERERRVEGHRAALSVAERMQLLRWERGFTQQELADRLGVTQSMVSLWETGQREPRSSTVRERLEALERGEQTGLPGPDRRDFDEAVDMVAARLFLPGAADAIRFLAGAAREPGARPEFHIRADTPDAAAAELRVKAGSEQVPVDVSALLRACGARVNLIECDLALTVVIVDAGEGPVVGINKRLGRRFVDGATSDDDRRMRFVNGIRYPLAHALGHILLGHVDRIRIDVMAAGAHPAVPKQRAIADRRADEFAARLLMPDRLLQHACRDYARPGRLLPDERDRFKDERYDVLPVERLAALFGVDEMTMALRLAWLGMQPLGLPDDHRS